MYHIHLMTEAWAQEIATWTYENEYAIYSFQPNEETFAELTSGEYYACIDGEGRLRGYFCFGSAARIPAVEPGAYPDGFLDFGLGMKPEFCGNHLGAAFLKAGMDYAWKTFHPAALRLTVAEFNKRAITLYRKAGFQILHPVTHKISGRIFQIMCSAAAPFYTAQKNG